ncbi:PREDICTED: uncharacterized protein LOC106806098 [Priapulus caudatus]|uniref:Uncharacterized protein LOC106806098 n=1 Tax=Priapulus caudatus TaxID=37621 RepID=A0ABM1DU17_PRICU|nr:PREDICTED: uncharacterized protein LOC106806098 [Priapulus caudatus]
MSDPKPDDPVVEAPKAEAGCMTHHVGFVSVKLPPYWPADPMVWFGQAEAQFATRGITVEETRFFHIVSALQPEIAVEVRDLIITPPASKPYTTLKAELIKRTSASEQRRVQLLLSEEELGDKKPSQLLRRMRQLLGDRHLEEGIFKELFLQRLPPNVRVVLAASVDAVALDALATLADRIMDVHIPQIAAAAPVPQAAPVVGVSTGNLSLEEKVNSLVAAVSQLQARLEPRSRPAYRGRNSGRNPSQSRERKPVGDLCWYHQRFGAQAHKCIPPCKSDRAENAHPGQ